MQKLLHEVVRERRLVCDGAMGTQLMLAGLESGQCGERWNVTHPEPVLATQQRYGVAGDVRRINEAAVRIAREAFGGRAVFVLGDIGTVGAILEPYGDLSQAEARLALEEQA